MNKWRLLLALFALIHLSSSFSSGLVDGRRQCSDRLDGRRLLYGSQRKTEAARLETRGSDHSRRDGVRTADGFRKSTDYRNPGSERELTRQIVAFRRSASERNTRERDTDSLHRKSYTDTDVRGANVDARRTERRAVRDNLEGARLYNDGRRYSQVRGDERLESGRLQSRQARAYRERTYEHTRRTQVRGMQENEKRRETRRLERDNVGGRSARDERSFSDDNNMHRDFRSESERRFRGARTRSMERQTSPLNVRVNFQRARDVTARVTRYQSERRSPLGRFRDLGSHGRSMERASMTSKQRDTINVRERHDATEVRGLEVRNRDQRSINVRRSTERENRTGRSTGNSVVGTERPQSVERRTRDARQSIDRLRVSQSSEQRQDTRMPSHRDVRNSRSVETEIRDVAGIRNSEIREARVTDRLTRSVSRDRHMYSRLDRTRESQGIRDYERRDSRINDVTRKLTMERDSVFYRSGRLTREKTEVATSQSYNWSYWLHAAQGAYLCYILVQLAGEKRFNKMRSRNLWTSSAPKLVKVD